jgi:hypothetical protein
MKFTLAAATLAFLLVTVIFAQGERPADKELKRPPVKKAEKTPGLKYAIVVANRFFAGEGGEKDKWAKVVDELKKKYSARVFKYDGELRSNETLKKDLAEYRPYYVCFVEKPENCGKRFVKGAIVLMHSLDDDPYDDAVWAILTGYNAGDAMKIVKARPLKVKRHLSHVSSGRLSWFESGVSFNEAKQHEKWVKKKGKDPEKVKGPADTTEQWVKEVNREKVDIITTSGHATERDWMMGYNYKNGKIVPAGEGKLVGVSSENKGYAITKKNPKIFFSIGNCLIAHIPPKLKDCMCLSWIHSGAYQFFGHIEVQYRSCTAWGICNYFFCLQDQFTFAQAVHANRIAAQYIMDNHTKGFRKGYKKNYWNRCLHVTVLYGDPAWQVKMKRTTEPLYETDLKVTDDKDGRKKITMTVEFKRKHAFRVTALGLPCALLPYTISDWKVEKSDAVKTVIGDNFILLGMIGKEYDKGDKAVAVITCKVDD